MIDLTTSDKKIIFFQQKKMLDFSKNPPSAEQSGQHENPPKPPLFEHIPH